MRITQKDRIMNYIRQYGYITSRDAYNDLGITQLGARIDDLQKEGYKFKKEWINGIDRYGQACDYKKYSLIEDPILDNQEHITI